MEAGMDCSELVDKAVGVERRAGGPRRWSLPPTDCPYPHRIPVHPDPLQGWPRSSSAGKSSHAVVPRSSSWSGMWDIGHLLAGPAKTSPLTPFLGERKPSLMLRLEGQPRYLHGNCVPETCSTWDHTVGKVQNPL